MTDDRPQDPAFPWLAALLVPWALLTARFWFVCDDAYISFRYAQNLSRGLGMVFNVGEVPPVEGYSNFLWVVLAAAFEWLGIDVVVVMPALSALCGAAGIAYAFHLARVRFGVGSKVAFAATLPLALSPAYAVWSTSGLATMPFALSLFALFDLWVLQGARRPWLGFLAALCVGLLRSEGLAWIGVVAAMAVLVGGITGRRPERGDLPPLLVLALIFVAYHSWRLQTFGTLVPNTALVKVGFGPDQLLRGARYVMWFFLGTLAPLAALVGLPAAWRWGPRAWALAALVMAFPAFAMAVGGDFMPYGRMLFPGLLLASPLLALGLMAWKERALAIGAVLGVVAVLPVWEIHLVPMAVRRPFHVRLSDEEVHNDTGKWANMASNAEGFELRGRALALIADPDDAVVSGAVGAISYFSDRWIWDTYGLVTKEVAYRPFHGPLRESPGHDKRVAPEYFARYAPRFLYARALKGERAASSMQYSFNRWAVDPLVMDQYVPDWMEVELEGVDERTFLFVIRRVEAGEDPAALWNGFDARRRELNTELRAEARAAGIELDDEDDEGFDEG